MSMSIAKTRAKGNGCVTGKRNWHSHSPTAQPSKRHRGRCIVGNIATSIYGVQWNNLNWGYQIVHDTLVLAAIHDTVGGPTRTKECTEEAKRIYELLCNVYERLYCHSKPTQPQLNLLAHIIKGSKQDEWHSHGWVNVHSARALIRRNIIKSVNRDPWLSRYYRKYVVLDGNMKPVKLWT